jgi:hypothetical protein
MAVKRALLWWWVKPQLPWVVLTAVIAAAYTLLRSRPLEGLRGSWEVLFLLFASFFLAIPQTPSGGKAGFLYTRGYSRDAIWAHSLLATVLTLVMAWAAPAFIVWTGLRSAFQDRVTESAYYPLMRSPDAWVPLWWILALLVLVPVFHYATVRLQQPTRGRFAGGVTAIAAVVAWLALLSARPQGQWFWAMVALCAVVMAAVMLIASLKLHRRMEVRQWTA